jgi:hypothetical protein
VPWGLADARTSFFTTVGGLGAVLVAWWGASGTGQLDRQTGWTVLGIAGIIVLGVGNAFWLLAGRRAVGTRRARLLDVLESLDAGRPAAAPGATLVAVAGSKRYHVDSCILVRGKPVRTVKPSAPGRRRPCEMCQR